MTDCYWGGTEDQYYYEVDSGRIIGQIIPNSDGIYKAFYFDAWNNSGLGDFIDSARARKAVENARAQTIKKWERQRAAWNSIDSIPLSPPEPPPGRKINYGTWWKIWE